MESHYFKLGLVLLGINLAVSQNVTFIILGDWGDTALPGQQQVADQMGLWAEEHDARFIVSTGDNFYPNGVRSVDDRQFDTQWRDVYTHPAVANLSWYMTVGNHDYGRDNGEEWNQVEFSYIEPRWRLPHLWHSVYIDIPGGNRRIHLINIDSECIGRQINNHTVMMEWLEDELANSQGDWQIIAAHRPIYSVGDDGPWDTTIENAFQHLLDTYNAHAYIAGHDHNLQHLHHENNTRTEYIISGAGGALVDFYNAAAEETLYRERGVVKLHFERTWGFTGMTLSDDMMHLEFIDNNGTLVYDYSRPIW